MFFRQILSITLLLGIGAQSLSLGAQEVAASEVADSIKSPNASRRSIPTRLGTVDAISGNVDFRKDLGPKIPGRLPVGFQWRTHTTNLSSTLLPVVWPGYDIEPVGVGWGQGGPSTVEVDVLGERQSLYLLAPTHDPQDQTLATWLKARGVELPFAPSAAGGQWSKYASTDGQTLYVVCYSPTQTVHPGAYWNGQYITFRAILKGDMAVWEKWIPGTANWNTYFTNLWGDKISVIETGGKVGLPYTATITNENDTTEKTQLTLNSSTLLCLLPVSIAPNTLPFTGQVSNSLGAANVSLNGYYNCDNPFFSYWTDLGSGSGAICTQIPSFIYNRSYILCSITQSGPSGENLSTQFSYDYDRNNYVLGFKISHPNGVNEKFDLTTAYINDVTCNSMPLGGSKYATPFMDLEFLMTWQYQMPAGSPQTPPIWRGMDFPDWIERQGNWTLLMKGANSCVNRITTDGGGDQASDQTVWVFRQYPVVQTSHVPRSNGGFRVQCTFTQPKYVTTVLVYPSANPSGSFRGSRFVHTSGTSWNDPMGPDVAMFYGASVLWEESIHGSGGPQVNGTDPISIGQATFNWQPTANSYQIDRTRVFEGWDTRSWLNPGGSTLPWVTFSHGGLNLMTPASFVATRSVVYEGTPTAPRLPVHQSVEGDPAITGSRDLFGPVRTDQYLSAPSAAAQMSFVGSQTIQAAAPKWNAGIGSPSGDLVQKVQNTRIVDNNGLLLVTRMERTLAGPALSFVVRGVQNGAAVDLGTTDIGYDSLGRVTSRTKTQGSTVQTESIQYFPGKPLPSETTQYLSTGQLGSPSFSGQVGKIYNYETGSHNWLSKETDKLTGRSISYPTHDAFGHVTTSIEDQSGIATTYVFDAWGNLTQKTRNGKGLIGAAITKYTYDPFGSWKEETVILPKEGKTLTTHTDLDSAGRPIKVIRPDKAYQRTVYDGWGQVIRKSGWIYPQQTEYWLQFQYDGKGRLLAEIDAKNQTIRSYPDEPLWQSLTQDGQTVQGTVSKVVDDRGQSLIEVRNLLGQRTAMIDQASHLTTFANDAYGNLVETNNAGQIRKFEYNVLGWLLAKDEPEEGRTEFTNFTMLGVPCLQRKLGRSRQGTSTIETTLDGNHRPQRIQVKDASGVIRTARTLHFRADFNVPDALSETQDNGTLSEAYGYDDIGRLNSKTVSDGNQTFAVRQTLDALGLVTNLTYPSVGGRTDVATMAYDEQGRLKTVTLNGESIPRGSMIYDQVSGTAVTQQLVYGNGASTTSTVDRGELVRTLHVVPDGHTEDNAISWTAGGLMLGRGPDTFAYDKLQRLASAHVLNPQTGTFVDQSFDFDRFGNRISSNTTAPGGSLAADSEALSWTASYTNGNDLPATVSAPGGSLSTGVLYDDLGRMKQVWTTPGQLATQTSWLYDPAGRVVKENGTSYLLDAEGLRFKRTKADGSVQYTVYGFNREPLIFLSSAPPSIAAQTVVGALPRKNFGANPTYYVGDFNGDGRKDVLIKQAEDQRTFIRLGQSDGQLGSPIETTQSARFGSSPSIYLGDFNGDGKTDVMFKQTEDQRTYIQLGQSNGQLGYYFETTQSARFSSNPSVYLGDFNGDGKTDVMFKQAEDQRTYIQLGQSNGQLGSYFETTQSARFGSNPSLYLGDFNGDGKTDVLFKQSEDQRTYIQLGQSNGQLGLYFETTQSAQFENNPTIYLGDFNGDGRTDVLFKQIDNRTYIQLAQPGGQLGPYFETTQSARFENNPTIYLGDFNGDGRTDVLFKQIDNRTYIQLAQPDGQLGLYFETTQSAQFENNPTIYLGDFNGDGRVDLLFLQPDQLTYLQLGQTNGQVGSYFETAPVLAWQRSMVYAFGQLISESQPTGTIYIQGDQVGSPNLTTDDKGVLVNRTKNLPFGERLLDAVPTAPGSARRFTNHEDDPDSNAIYMQARTYLAAYGKFAQVDPMYDQKTYSKDSWNLYAYVANNPVTHTDPTGQYGDIWSHADQYGLYDDLSNPEPDSKKRPVKDPKPLEEAKVQTAKTAADAGVTEKQLHQFSDLMREANDGKGTWKDEHGHTRGEAGAAYDSEGKVLGKMDQPESPKRSGFYTETAVEHKFLFFKWTSKEYVNTGAPDGTAYVAHTHGDFSFRDMKKGKTLTSSPSDYSPADNNASSNWRVPNYAIRNTGIDIYRGDGKKTSINLSDGWWREF